MQKQLISPVLNGGFVEMDRALLYMPHIGQGVNLEQEVCSTTPIKMVSYQELETDEILLGICEC